MRDATGPASYLCRFDFFVACLTGFCAGFCTGASAIWRVTDWPVAFPLGDSGVKVSVLMPVAAERRRPARMPGGSVKRRSWFRGRGVPEPSPVEPMLACSRPEPFASTVRRACVAVAERRMSSGPYTVIAGGVSAVGAEMTGPQVETGSGGAPGVAGVVVSIESEVVTTKSAPSIAAPPPALFDAFGSDRNPSFPTQVHVPQGIEAAAVFPVPTCAPAVSTLLATT